MKFNKKYATLALISALTIFLQIDLFSKIKDIDYSIFYNMNVLMISLACIAFYFLYKVTGEKKISKSKTVLAVFFAICMIIGEVCVSSGTYLLIFKNIATLVLSIIKGIGYFSIFKVGFIYLDKFLSKIKLRDIKLKNKKLKWYMNQLETHPFRTSLISILVVWSIYIIAFYPIVLSPDPSFQIRQYFNVPTKYVDWVIQRDPNVFMTSHHPITQTFLIGWCIEFGRMILNDNFGLFCYTIFQTIIYSSILAYTVKFARDRNVSNKFCLILLGLYLFVPMFAFYSISAVKDTLYTAFMILYILFIYDVISKDRDQVINIKSLISLFFIMLLISLFRHNGLYVILLSLPFVIIYAKKNILKLSMTFILFFMALYGFDNVLVPHLGISGGSVREMLSVPFQQTARYVKYHGDELSKEDIEIIDYILNYDTLAKRYKPEISDPVKNEFNKYTTNKELVAYFKVWFKGLIKHPDTYIDATLNNIYGYFYPNAHKWYVYTTYDERVTKNDLVDYHFNDLVGLREVLTLYGNIFPYIPIVGLLSSIGANTWVVLILGAYIITKNKKKYLIVLVPFVASILICVISPVNTYFRYTMPYVFPLPVVTMLLMKDLRGEENEKK